MTQNNDFKGKWIVRAGLEATVEGFNQILGHWYGNVKSLNHTFPVTWDLKGNSGTYNDFDLMKRLPEPE